jgi:hypothetical protein
MAKRAWTALDAAMTLLGDTLIILRGLGASIRRGVPAVRLTRRSGGRGTEIGLIAAYPAEPGASRPTAHSTVHAPIHSAGHPTIHPTIHSAAGHPAIHSATHAADEEDASPKNSNVRGPSCGRRLHRSQRG